MLKFKTYAVYNLAGEIIECGFETEDEAWSWLDQQTTEEERKQLCVGVYTESTEE